MTGGIPQGKWTKMDPIPGAITVNIGNMLMRLSDNKLKSTYHRVRALEEGESSVREMLSNARLGRLWAMQGLLYVACILGNHCSRLHFNVGYSRNSVVITSDW